MSKKKRAATQKAIRMRADRPTRLPPASTAARLCALAIAGLCLAPFVVWGNPYPDEVIAYWAWGIGCAALAGVVAVSGSARSVVAELAAALRRPSPVAFGAMVGALAFALSAFFAVYVFHRLASTSDELATLWHARILLSGRFSLPVDPNREFFGLDTVVDTGRWYSQFPIGGPLALLPGALIGMPWLVNPVLAGASTVMLYVFARRAFDEDQARAGVALFSVTPMFLIMAGTWMNHIPVLFLTTCSLAAVAAWDRAQALGRRLVFAALIGLALGAMATIRPLDAVAVAVAIGVLQLFTIRAEWTRVRELAVQVVGGVVGVAPLFYANRATTGSALRFGYDAAWGAGHRVGFHTDPYGAQHTLGRAFEHAITYLGELNVYLMAWPVPSLLVLVGGLFFLRNMSRWRALLVGIIGAQVVAYAAYWGEGEFLGPRFLFTALPAFVLLIAQAPFSFTNRWRASAVAFVVACVGVAWCLPVSPFSVWGLANGARQKRFNLKIDVAAAARAADVHHALVFLREPFSARLTRRLWGAGMTRSETAQLLRTRDACSLFDVVRRAESDSLATSAVRRAMIDREAAPLTGGGRSVAASDPAIRVSSAASLTTACKAEIESDRTLPIAAFGPALAAEPIDAAGHIDGDVVYAADLGERNAVLRARFGDRRWYRLAASGPGRTAAIIPY